LAAKLVNQYAITKLSSLIAPVQLGVGVPGGVEAAVHATRRYLQHLPPNNAIVKLDFRNAFNTIRRDAILEASHTALPEV
jgi:hypothetical protein